MTCIVGMVDGGNVWLGADSAGVAGLSISTRKDPKVFRNGDAIMAMCGSFRMGNILRFGFSTPRRHPDTDVYQYMCTDFVNGVRQAFKDGGFMGNLHGADEAHHSAFIVGYAGRLFTVESDFQVGEHYDPYMANGCGQDLALGALHALCHVERARGLPPQEILAAALQAAATYSGGVVAPFLFEKL